jgi:hypothetical protein
MPAAQFRGVDHYPDVADLVADHLDADHRDDPTRAAQRQTGTAVDGLMVNSSSGCARSKTATMWATSSAP